MARRSNAREAILEAAENLVLEKGVNALTIDTVALMTGLGKGGVLYHFKYKVDLLQGLLERHCNRWDRMVRETTAQAGNDVYAWMDCFLDFAFEDKGDLHRSGIAIIAAASRYPELLEPIRELYSRRHRHLFSQFSDPHLAAVILLAADGFGFFNAISIPPIDESLQPGMRQRMGELIEQMRQQAAAS